MFVGEAERSVDNEISLATRAAWLSYIGGYRQEDIATRLAVSRVKVNRLIAFAHRKGLVRVFVEGTPAECVRLEDALAETFGLRFCSVAPSIDEELSDGLPLHTLGTLGARWLHHALETSGVKLVGVGHGRTLAAVVDRLPRVSRPDVQFVSLLGSLTRTAAANPFDVIQRLAERTGGESYFLPVPFFADSIEDKAVLSAQTAVRHALALGSKVELVVLGIGEVRPDARMVRTGIITQAEYDEVRRKGAVGEALGTYFDANGKPVAADLNQRSMAARLDDLRGREIVAVAGGLNKVDAIAGVLRTGAVTGLITDEATATRLTEGFSRKTMVRPPSSSTRKDREVL